MRVVDGRALVESGQNPVVDAAHVIDELLLAEGAAACDAIGPDEVAADARVVAIVEADDDHIVGVACNALVVFGKHLASCPDEQVGPDFLCIVVDEFGTQAAPIFVDILVSQAVVVDGEVDPVVESVDGCAS